MSAPSVLSPVTDTLGAHAGKLLALSGAGGLLGGYLSSQEKGSPRETPADRRKRILKNALGYALATGGIGATGLGAASLLASTEGTEGGISPWKNALGRLGIAAPIAALTKYTATSRMRNGTAGTTALNDALARLGNPQVPDGKGGSQAVTAAELKTMPSSQIAALARAKGITSQQDLLGLHDQLRRGNAGHSWFGNLRSNSDWLDSPVQKGPVVGKAIMRNKLPAIAGGVAAFAPQLLNAAGTALGWTAKD